VTQRILATRIVSEQGLVSVRDRTRQVGDLFGLDGLQRTRLITAVSEIARNVIQYAGAGVIEFYFRPAQGGDHQAVQVRIIDTGPGIANVQAVLEGQWQSGGRNALGISGSKRLVDRFTIDSTLGAGTLVTLEMRLPLDAPLIDTARLGDLVEQLARRKLQSSTEELEQQNREMLVALEALRMRQAELEQADERKDEFLAMLAHELRNPLAAIRTALEVLKRKSDASIADRERLESIIGRQTDQLSRLVNDLLDVSRVMRGKVKLEREPVGVKEIIEHALEMTHAVIVAKKHTVTVKTPSEDSWILADRIRFKQILGNLLHNAARYTPAHGAIDVTVTNRGQEVVIDVADNGIGIAAAMLPRVFDLFSQADTGLGRQGAGLGIGLTIVQRMLQAHSAKVTVSSPGLGQGSIFSIVVPQTEARPVGVTIQPQSGWQALSVLIIDDNIDAAEVLQEVLDVLGHGSRICHSGEQGLQLAAMLRPHIIIVDIGLPGMNGFEVARALRASCHNAHMRIVALSGYSATSMRAHGDANVFDHYLEKPVSIDTLQAALASLY
jgi:signal transduction histidine kinase